MITSVLIACGGGDGDSPPVVTPSPAPTPVEPTPPGAKALPQGIFNSAAIKGRFENESTQVTSSINRLDFVSGTLIKIKWADINPAAGEYDLSLIAEEIEAAKLLDSKISLIILDSKEIPDFVLAGCETFDFSFRGTPEQTCLPWDEVYLGYKQAMVEAVGDAFDESDALAYVYITYAAMTNGAEMHWRVSERTFREAGYTSSRLADAYHTVTDFYANAFPNTPLAMEVHTVFDDDYLATSAWQHCNDVREGRCGIALWWCASRLATTPSSSEYAVFSLAQEAAKTAFAVCQTIASMTNEPERFDEGQGLTSLEVFDQEMSFFLGEGLRVFEFWTDDIKNDAIQSRIRQDMQPVLRE